MSKFTTIKKLWRADKHQIVVALYNNIVHTGITNLLSDETYLRLTYWIRFGEKLNLQHPVTFNQKLQWLKLHDRNPNYVKMVDKVLAKEYVAGIIGNKYIIPTLGVYNSFDEIDFNVLPDKFVLKCNHDSGSVVICRDKSNFNVGKARKKLSKGLKTDAFYWGREYPYKFVERKILAESYLEDSSAQDLKDYKFFCFGGKPFYCQVISNRSTNETIDFYDMEWNLQEFVGLTPLVKNSGVLTTCPVNFELMKRFSETLSVGLPFSRIDFYESCGKLYFGEITLYPAAGFGQFFPNVWNYKLGELIDVI